MAKTATPKPRETDKLTDAKCRDAKAARTPLKLSDGGGVYLHIATTQKKTWWLAYARPARRARSAEKEGARGRGR